VHKSVARIICCGEGAQDLLLPPGTQELRLELTGGQAPLEERGEYPLFVGGQVWGRR